MVASAIPRTDMPFEPQSVDDLAARYPDALATVWSESFMDEIVSLHTPVPPQNVFDFAIGLRLLINLFDSREGRIVMLSAKPHPSQPMWSYYHAGQINPLQMFEFVQVSHRSICPDPKINMKYFRTSDSGRMAFTHPLPAEWPQPE